MRSSFQYPRSCYVYYLRVQFTISNDPERSLVRAVEVGRFLRAWTAKWLCLAKVGEASHVTASEYPGSTIDYFVSHAWSARSYEKICFMILRFSSGAPLFVAFSISLFCRHHLLLPPSLCVLINWFTLLICFVVEGILHPSRDSMFFDYYCIRQSDPELRAIGIGSIDQAISASRRFAVMWSHSYSQRLWCVYEAGVFLYDHSDVNVEVWPQCLVSHVLFWGTLRSVYWAFQLARPTVTATVLYVVLGAVFIVLEELPVLQAFARDVEACPSTANLACTAASDRDALRGKIASLYGSVDALRSKLGRIYWKSFLRTRLSLIGLIAFFYPTLVVSFMPVDVADMMAIELVRPTVYVFVFFVLACRRIFLLNAWLK